MDDCLIDDLPFLVSAPVRPFVACLRNVATPGSRAASDGAFALDPHPFNAVTR